MQLGLGKPEPDALVVSNQMAAPMPPNYPTRRWQDAYAALGLPR